MSLISGIVEKIASFVKSVNYAAVVALTKPIITQLVFETLDKVKAKIEETGNELDNRIFNPVYNDMKENWDDWFDVLLSAAGLIAVPQGDGEVTYTLPPMESSPEPAVKELILDRHSEMLREASERTELGIGTLVTILIELLPVILRFFSR